MGRHGVFGIRAVEQFVLGGKGLGQDEKKERVQQVHNQSSVRVCV